MDLAKQFQHCETSLRGLFDIKSAKAHRTHINNLLHGINAPYPDDQEVDLTDEQVKNRHAEINNLLAHIVATQGLMNEDPDLAIEEGEDLARELIESANRTAYLSANPESAGKHDIATESLRENGRGLHTD